MKAKTLTSFIALAIGIVYFSSIASAIILSSVDADTFYPGEEGNVNINVENNLNTNVQDVSFSINLGTVQFTSVGASADSTDDIKKGNEESFSFVLRAASDIKPGDYDISYTILYTDGGVQKQNQGTFGVHVSSKTNLEYVVQTDTPVLNSKGKVSLEIINKGFGDVKFVSVQIVPNGFSLLSSDKTYIGTVSSDDFETANFDAIFTSLNPTLTASVSFKDFENHDITQQVSLPFEVYTKEKALELGIITQSQIGKYIIGLVILVILYLIYRRVKKVLKKGKRKKEMEAK